MKNKTYRIFFIALPVFAVLLLFSYLNFFEKAEYFFYDDRMNRTASYFSPSEEIVLILVDQKSLSYAAEERGWQWPWKREAYSELVDFFSECGAKAVAFDMLFTEPSSYGNDDDNRFIASCANSGNVVQTVFFDAVQGTAPSWNMAAPLPQKNQSGIKNDSEFPALFPIDGLCRTAAALGNVNSLPDSDGTIRRARLFYNWNGYSIPTLGTAAFLSADGTLNKDIPRIINLRFKKSIDDYVPYSAGDILKAAQDIKDGKEADFSLEDFKDMYVFFGLYAPGLFDICRTPISAAYPGVGVHITLLDNILSNDKLIYTPKGINMVILFACIILSILPSISAGKIKKRRLSFFVLAFSIAVLISVYLVLSYILFAAGIIIPVASVLFAMISAYVVSLAVSYMSEGKQKRYLKNAFKQYLSPVVIEQLIANPEQLKLGGERKELTMFFSDLQGFTSISESLNPEALTELLNYYLSAMSSIILDSGGTIDKYEGDAIIAFWNAPAPIQNHARMALEAAYTCQKKLEEMRPELEKQTGGKPFKMRIGLNTGFAIVGNMGSTNRFDYTMLGDAVNLAARLEGLNKQFGTYTMCSESAKKAAEKGGTNLKFRELARAAVVGKNEPVTVYEIMDEQTYTEKSSLLQSFGEGLHEFYAGNFKKALLIFEQTQNEDPAAMNYAKKCAALCDTKPDGEWLGIWKAETK